MAEPDDDGPSPFDPYGVADEIDELAEWVPGSELPGEALVDAEWLRKRAMAFRFARAEADEIEHEFRVARERIEARIEELFSPELRRLAQREAEVLHVARGRVENLADQLTAYHAARVREAEAAGKTGRGIPTRIQTPWLDLTSRAPGVEATVVVHDREAAVAWLEEIGREELVETPEPKPRPNVTAVRELIDDGVVVAEVACRECGGHKTNHFCDRCGNTGTELAFCPDEIMSVDVKRRTFDIDAPEVMR